MLNDFRKSIQSVLYERVQSPVSGAFFFSWIVWNWKLIFYLIFSNVLISERITFVQENYINIRTNLVFPFLSTIILITVYPFITTGGYWVWLKFKTWQIKIRNEIEKNRLLTLEQSIRLRMQIRDQELEFDKMLTKRDDEIELLKRQLEESNKSKAPDNRTRKLEEQIEMLLKRREEELRSLQVQLEESKNSKAPDNLTRKLGKQIERLLKIKEEETLSLHRKSSSTETVSRDITKESEVKLLDPKEFEQFKKHPYSKYLEPLIEVIMNGAHLPRDEVPASVVAYYESNKYIEQLEEKSYYKFTQKGQELVRIYLDNLQ